MDRAFAVVGGIIVVLVVGGGAFVGGMAFERSRGAGIRESFFAERGIGEPGDFREGQGGQRGFGGFRNEQNGGQFQEGGFGRGAFGEISSIEGDTLLLSTAQNVTTVILSDETTITQFVTGALDDLQPNQRITVIGQRNDDDEIVAVAIQILPEIDPQ